MQQNVDQLVGGIPDTFGTLWADSSPASACILCQRRNLVSLHACKHTYCKRKVLTQLILQPQVGNEGLFNFPQFQTSLKSPYNKPVIQLLFLVLESLAGKRISPLQHWYWSCHPTAVNVRKGPTGGGADQDKAEERPWEK